MTGNRRRSVAAGATATITASVDAAGLTAGSYTAMICVHSNDPAHALIEVPVTANVLIDPADVIFADMFELP